MRWPTALSCSPTVLSITGLTCAGTLTLAPASDEAGVAEHDLRRQIGLDAPGGGELRPRGDGDIALDLGAGVERLDVDAADLLGGIAAEQAADRVADRAGRLRRQRARDIELAVQRRRQRQHVLGAGRRIGPREAVQPMSAFCRSCDTGLSALPAKLRGAARSAASRMAASEIATGAITNELRGAGGSGGNWASCRRLRAGRAGDSQSMAFRLMKNETATTATPSRIGLEAATAAASSPRINCSRESTGRGGAQGAPGCRRADVHEKDATGNSAVLRLIQLAMRCRPRTNKNGPGMPAPFVCLTRS